MIIPSGTLNECLFLNGITKDQACDLFGRSPATLKRWNDNPPPWVLRIIKLIGVKPSFPDEWEDWHFDRHWLVDPAGNAFHINDVKNLWIERQLSKSLRGDSLIIHSMKLELEKRLNALDSEISITINIGNIEKEFKIAL